MNKSDCVNCIEFRRCREDRAAMVFFVIGLISTVAIRVINVAAALGPAWGKATWYIGVGGFLVYFFYKYRIDAARNRLIQQKDILGKIARGEQEKWGDEDRAVLHAVVCSLTSNKDRINYFVIFVSSAAVLGAAVYFDFLR